MSDKLVEVVVLGSGSAGNSIAVRFDNNVLLIDAGFSGAEMDRRLSAAGIDSDSVIALAISHEHDDHITGARVFAKRNGQFPVYANSLTSERLRSMNKAPENMMIFSNGVPFEVGPFTVEGFSVSHDAVDPVGFTVRCSDKKIGIATDLGYAGKMVTLKLSDCHVLILESNHDRDMLLNSSRPAYLRHRIRGRRGHLSNQSAAELLVSLVGPSTQHVVLAHMSDDCNEPELAKNLMAAHLAPLARHDINLIVAPQNRIADTIII